MRITLFVSKKNKPHRNSMYGGSRLVPSVISPGFSVGGMLCVVTGGQVYPATGGLGPGGAGGKAPKPGLHRPAHI